MDPEIVVIEFDKSFSPSKGLLRKRHPWSRQASVVDDGAASRKRRHEAIRRLGGTSFDDTSDGRRPNAFGRRRRTLNRQQSASANELREGVELKLGELQAKFVKSPSKISKSTSDVKGSVLRLGSDRTMALSQIWTVPTNCGCCEHGQDDRCERLSVGEIRQKFDDTKATASETSEVVSVEVPTEETKPTEPEKPKEAKIDDGDDPNIIVKVLSWMGLMRSSSKKADGKWVERQVPAVPRAGITKDAKEPPKTSQLFLNVLVEYGSGVITITPVASAGELLKIASVCDVEEVKQQQQKVVDYYPGLYFAFS